MKQEYVIQKKLFVNMLLKIPAIDASEILNDTENGFKVEIQLNGGIHRMFNVHVLKRAYPQQIKEVIDKNCQNQLNVEMIDSFIIFNKETYKTKWKMFGMEL